MRGGGARLIGEKDELLAWITEGDKKCIEAVQKNIEEDKKSSTGSRKFLKDGSMVLPHNTVEINGEDVISLLDSEYLKKLPLFN